VPEGELVLAGLHQHAPADQVAQPGDQLVLTRAGHRGEQVERDAMAEHRGGLDDPVTERVEIVDLAAQHVGEAPRQRLLDQRLHVVPGHRAQQLLQEERVATGAVVQRRRGTHRRRGAGGRGQQRRGLRGGETIQPYVGDGMPAFHPREQPGHRLPPGHLVRPVRADEQPRPPLVGDPLEQHGTLRVGPVQILEDDDRRRVPDQLGQQRQPGVQPLDRTAPRVGERRQLLLVDLRPPVDGVQQHLVRPGQRTGLGVADQDHGPGRDGRQQLVDQAGLADARLTRDERDRRLPRRGEPRQPAQLAVAPDHHRAGTAAEGSHAARLPVGRPRTLGAFRARRASRAMVSRRPRSASAISSRWRSLARTSSRSGWFHMA
jgi:hypothetical protein